ncbi:ribosome small subunit-dependent GTPase A [bacterium]|nr:ribosome small subunit-dependent GTPase A [bacterium]
MAEATRQDGARNDAAAREGTVIRAGAGHCQVVVGDETWRCRVRGRLKQGPRQVQTVVVAGDRVLVRPVAGNASPGAGGEAVVEEVLPRRNRLSRLAARRSGGRVEQVLMANLDLVVVVQSVRDPEPQTGFVDRLLAAALRFGVDGVVVVNKLDLCDAEGRARELERWHWYRRLGNAVIAASATTGEGLAELGTLLGGRVALLLGASGVGKSSLLNALYPGLDLRVNAVTGRTGLGRHTTTHTELHPVPGGGFIADSPGLRGFDPWDIAPAGIGAYFPDLEAESARCRFRGCLHRDEPDCGVKDAVARGALPAWRWEGYLALLRDLEDRRKATGYRS